VRTGKAALGFIFVTILLDMLALGVIVPVLPTLVTTFTHGDTGKAAEAIGLYATVWALMQFVFSPVLGLLSDRFGRRPVILLSNAGLALDYAVMALAPTLAWLFLGRVLSGITSASVPTAIAYMSDVTPPEDRARSFGFVGAAFGLGFVVGPAVGGWLGVRDPRLPFWVAGALSLANAMWGLFVLPESLPKGKRRERLDLSTANPLGTLALLRRHRELLGLSLVNFLGWVAHEVYPVVFVLYAGYRYGWNESRVGTVLAAVGAMGIVVSAGLVGPVVKRFGERSTLLLGTLLGAAGFALYGLAPTGAFLLAAIPVSGLWGLAGPASQALMSRRVSGSEQGELQGALGSVRSLAMLVAPSIFSFTFAAAIAPGRAVKVPGAPWFVASALLVAAASLAWAVTRPAPAPPAARPL
jgi:MFS transporter, DHA1 family, tetracycline resistance protein